MSIFTLSLHDAHPISLVLMALAAHGLAVGQTQVALGPLQSLDARLFIHTEDYRVLRWIQIESNDLRCLGSEDRCRSEEHTSELQSLTNIVCRRLLEKK